MSQYSPSPLWLSIHAKLQSKAADSTGYTSKLEELEAAVSKAKPNSPDQYDAQVALDAFLAQSPAEPHSSTRQVSQGERLPMTDEHLAALDKHNEAQRALVLNRGFMRDEEYDKARRLITDQFYADIGEPSVAEWLLANPDTSQAIIDQAKPR